MEAIASAPPALPFLSQWPVFHPGRHTYSSTKRSTHETRDRERLALLRTQRQRCRRRLQKKQLQEPLCRLRRKAKLAGPCLIPLLPRHAATTLFSFAALQSLPASFSKRINAIPEKGAPLFGLTESIAARAQRIALETLWARPQGNRPFSEQLVIDLARDHEKEMRLRLWFRALLAAWRYKRYARRLHADGGLVDPVTLDAIRVPVEMVDHKVKRLFVFEASALNKIVRQALLFQMYTVPDPQTPKNPYTNLPFTYGQLVGLHQQLLTRGCMSQEFHMWRQLGFSIDRFLFQMDGWLYLQAHRQELYDLGSEDGQQLLGDFIVECLDDLGRMPNPCLERLVRDAVVMVPDHDMLRRLRTLCLREIEAKFYGLPVRNDVLVEFHSVFKSKSDLWRRVRDKRDELSRAHATTDD